MLRPLPLALILGLSLAGAALAADLSVKDEMKTVVEPGASAIFSVGGDVALQGRQRSRRHLHGLPFQVQFEVVARL